MRTPAEKTLRGTFTLQLTERCNLACSYCYVMARERRSPDDCSPELCRDFIDFALREAGPSVRVAFFGGEPLLRMDLIRHTVGYGDAAAASAGKTISYHIVTNGTLLDEETGDFIARHGIGLEVSVDGPAAIHDRSRPFLDGSGSYATVHGNLLAFHRRHPEHPIRIFSVITDPHAFPSLQKLLRKVNASAFTFNEVTLPAGRQTGCADYRDIAARALKNRIARHRSGVLRGNPETDPGISRQMARFLKGAPGKGCDVGVDATIVTQQGEIYPCPFFVGHSDRIIGHIRSGFDADRIRPYLERGVGRQASCQSCQSCHLQSYCDGGCAYRAYRENGTIDVPGAESCRSLRKSAAELEKAIIALAARRPELLYRSLNLASDDPALHIPEQRQGYRNFIVKLTDQCNLACSYCYEKQRPATPGRLERDTAGALVDYIMASPVREPLISLFGGEPLLNWETGRFLVEEIAARSLNTGKRPFFHITTNGTLISDEIAAFFARHDVTVQISIDGSRGAHDANRRYADGSGSHAAISRGIARLRRANPLARIDAQVVLTPGNTDQVGIVRRLRKLGFRRINFLKAAWGERSGMAWPESAVRELARAREKFFLFFMEAAIEGHAEIDFGFAALVAAEPRGTAGLCECGSSEILIDTKGDFYPCPQIYAPGEHLLGNCADSDPGQAATVTAPLESIEDDCFRCWAYSRCRGGCAGACQRCPLVPSTLPLENRQPWCDLMRADFARAIIAQKILAHSHPESLNRLKSLFPGRHHE